MLKEMYSEQSSDILHFFLSVAARSRFGCHWSEYSKFAKLLKDLKFPKSISITIQNDKKILKKITKFIYSFMKICMIQ